jgi:hypothetical protein
VFVRRFGKNTGNERDLVVIADRYTLLGGDLPPPIV